MVESGDALAIMGNHELNAIHYHSTHPNSGLPLRTRSPKNQGQHESFLDEFPLGGIETLDQINWMKTLPLFLELEEFRVVHACWNSKSIKFACFICGFFAAIIYKQAPCYHMQWH